MSMSGTESASVRVGPEEKVIAPDGKPLNLTLLLKVVQNSGKPLPVGSFTARAVADKIKKLTGFNPTEVEIINGQHIVIDFHFEVPVVEVAQKVHGPILWVGMNSEISCLMSSRKSVLSIMNDRAESRNLQKELQEQRKAKEQEGEYVGKLEGLLNKFEEEVKRWKKWKRRFQPPKKIQVKPLWYLAN